MADLIVKSIDGLVELERKNGKLGTIVGLLLIAITLITISSGFVITYYKGFSAFLSLVERVFWG